VEQNRKAGQNPPRVVAPTEEEEDDMGSPKVYICSTSEIRYSMEP